MPTKESDLSLKAIFSTKANAVQKSERNIYLFNIISIVLMIIVMVVITMYQKINADRLARL